MSYSAGNCDLGLSFFLLAVFLQSVLENLWNGHEHGGMVVAAAVAVMAWILLKYKYVHKTKIHVGLCVEIVAQLGSLIMF